MAGCVLQLFGVVIEDVSGAIIIGDAKEARGAKKGIPGLFGPGHAWRTAEPFLRETCRTYGARGGVAVDCSLEAGEMSELGRDFQLI